ncbi:MAG: Rnase Y domain-containing protein, partial [Actinobacteria bacterium]|nr:Rnase Y domain-containing protein [Actinomycetota bacterium]
MDSSIALAALVALGIGVAAGLFIKGRQGAAAASQSEIRAKEQAAAGQQAQERAKQLLAEAEREAEGLVHQATSEVKGEIEAIRLQAEEESKRRREDLLREEKRLAEEEGRIAQRMESLERKSEAVEKVRDELVKKDEQMEEEKKLLEQAMAVQRRQLEKAAQMTAQEAREELEKQIIADAKRHAMGQVRELEERAREEGEERARKIVTVAIQRVASEQTTESTVSVFSLPSEEMKGRIIGREGRNIRAFEALTGVNLIIDDTPEAVVLSSFDPIRREAARLTLEKLVGDGRIHPARIEEMFERSQREMVEEIQRVGEAALLEVGIPDVHPEMIKVLGRLKFRSSYGQNVLRHLVESAHLAGVLASELGVDPTLPKRCA